MTELELAMNAGALAIEQNKRLAGTLRCCDALGDNQEIAYKEAARILRTTDAVEVVRCRECKHANTYNIPKWSAGVICKYWSEEADRTIDVPKNGYCFCGERKEK